MSGTGEITPAACVVLARIGAEIMDFATARCEEEGIDDEFSACVAMQSAIVDFVEFGMKSIAAPDKTAAEIGLVVAGVLDDIGNIFSNEAERYRAQARAATN